MKNPIMTSIAAFSVGLLLMAACEDHKPAGTDAPAKPSSQPSASPTGAAATSSKERPGAAPAKTPRKTAAEPNHKVFAMKHVTEKNYPNKLKRLEEEIARSEAVLEGLDGPAAGASPPPKAAGSASAKPAAPSPSR